MATKKVIRRNLPHNTTYNIVGSHYSLEQTLCANCGAVISHIAVVQDKNDDKFHVGLDCASTLSGISGTDELEDTQYLFKKMKKMRIDINREMKGGCSSLKVEYTIHGVYVLILSQTGGIRFRKTISENFTKKYLPELLKDVENPEKAGFSRLKISWEDVVVNGLLKVSSQEHFEPILFDLDGYSVKVFHGKNQYDNDAIMFTVEKDGFSQTGYAHLAVNVITSTVNTINRTNFLNYTVSE